MVHQTKNYSPCVAICVVLHNDVSTLESCLQSLINQQYKNFCVTIIDNYSYDHSVVVAQRMGFTVQKNNKNIGYPAAINQALRSTESKYVLTLNPDTTLDKWFIYHIVETMESQSLQVGSASGLLLRINDIKTRSNIIDSAGLYLRKNRRQGLRYESMSLSRAPLRISTIFGPDGAAAFYRREMLEDIKIGNAEVFDNDFFMHKDDVDVAWRAQLRGWFSICIPAARAYHIRTFKPGQRHKVSKY